MAVSRASQPRRSMHRLTAAVGLGILVATVGCGQGMREPSDSSVVSGRVDIGGCGGAARSGTSNSAQNCAYVPARGAEVELVDMSGKKVSTTADTSGHYSLTTSAGRYYVMAKVQSWSPPAGRWPTDVLITAESAPRSVEVKSGGSVAINLVIVYSPA